jgi:hypothetical protein
MIRKTILSFALIFFAALAGSSQAFVKTSDLLSMKRPAGTRGSLNITQERSLDTLVSRYIISRKKIRTIEGTAGIDGFRIQIYSSSVRAARDESAKARAEFISLFPDIISYAQYQEPGYFMVRAGDYRTKIRGYKYLLTVRKEFPDAILVPAVINFPDLIQK